MVHEGQTHEHPLPTQIAFNPLDSYNWGVTCLVIESRNRRWPFLIANNDVVNSACQAVIGDQLTSQTNYQRPAGNSCYAVSPLGSSLVGTVKQVFANGATAVNSSGTPTNGEPRVPLRSN